MFDFDSHTGPPFTLSLIHISRPDDDALGIIRRQRRHQGDAVLAAHRKLDALRQMDALDGLRHGHSTAGRLALLCRGRHSGLAALQCLNLAVAGHGYRAALHAPADGCGVNGLLPGLLVKALLVICLLYTSRCV